MLMPTHEARLDALRRELSTQKLDGFVIPIADEHMSEYVGAYAQRLAWLTGFGGSAGTAVVLKEKAAIFVDGRYTIQVREQVDARLFDYCSVPQQSVAGWLIASASQGARIGFDPWLHTAAWANATRNILAESGIELVPVSGNPVDSVWQDQPEPSPAAAFVQNEMVAGKTSSEKREELAEWLRARKLDAAVISALDSVAWLLNIRGRDVDRTPVALAYVIAHADGTAELFIAPEKVTAELTRHLGNAVTVRSRAEFEQALGAMGGKRVAVDPSFGVAAIGQALEAAGATVVAERDPTILAKAVKNPAEQEGHRTAQARDGAAMARFLHWLSLAAPKGGEAELSAAARLQAFREESGVLEDLSFDTISAAGPHAAIPPRSIYLVDSGGQYRDGTTDITRTVWIGSEDGAAQPSAEQKDRFTRVLKGHIALAMQVFPQGTSGGQLDVLARQFLWADGVDYAHGTGHGVGAFLSVHEGPQRIAKPSGGQAGTGQELLAGMILSNEPGYYKAGEYGIRIENLVLVEPREFAGNDGGDWLGFETLTLVPIDKALVDRALLSPAEVGWLNAYHARVREVLAPQLQGEVLAWLEEACAPL
jgi:Xaa-Pro aminopeptidase